MDISILNKINWHENYIKETKNDLKNTKDVRLYKGYYVLLKLFEEFTNRKIAEIENINKVSTKTIDRICVKIYKLQEIVLDYNLNN